MAIKTRGPKRSGGNYDEPGYNTGDEQSPVRHDSQTTPIMDPDIPGISKDTIEERERSNSPQKSTAEEEEKASLKESPKAEDNLNYTGDEEKTGRFSRFRGTFSRKNSTGLVIGGVVLFGGITGISVIQGPLEIITVGEALQKAFIKPNEDFGDDRSWRTVIYALSGAGERGKLGVVANIYQDKMETKLLERYGVKPIYYDNARSRHAGYLIVDENKARKGGFLTNIENEVPDARVTQANSIKGIGVRLGGGGKVSGTARVLYFPAGTKAKFIRNVNRLAVKSLGMNGVSTAIYSRQSIKRTGSSIKPFNGLREKRDQNADSAKAKRSREQFEKTFAESRDAQINGNTVKGKLSGKAKELSDKINEATKNKSRVATKLIRSSYVRGAAPVAVLGLMCSANDIGDAAQDAKYTSTVLPLIRNFWYIRSGGEQAKAGVKVSADELGAFQKTLYDKETGTHFLQAAPLQAERGEKPTGTDIPIEARVNDVAKKPTVLAAVDKVLDFGLDGPGPLDVKLSTGCSAISAVSNLPGFKQLGALMEKGINVALGTIGTSTDELTAGLISFINGKTVETNVAGGELGAVTAAGGKLAGIDQGLLAGAAPLTATQKVELDQDLKYAEILDKKTDNTFARYLDPYDTTSLTGSILSKAVIASSSSKTSFLNPAKMISSIFGGLSKPFTSNASAAPLKYEYGINNYGWSLADQNDDRWANPYDNAVIVEPQLDELNEKYSKCFGVKVTADDSGIHLENTQVDIIKLETSDEYKVCRQFTNVASTSSDNVVAPKTSFWSKLNPFSSGQAIAQAAAGGEPETAEAIMYKRYRAYLADSQAALSLACFEGDDQQSCDEVSGKSPTANPAPDQQAGGATEPPDEINGYKLSDSEKKYLKYIAENVVPKLSGDKARIAAESTWWALRERILLLDDAFGYSNCADSGNDHIPFATNCTKAFWQVGIAGVMYQNHDNATTVRQTATKLNPGKSAKEIIAQVSILAGHAVNSPEYNAAVNSTGSLQTSLLLRDPATGITLVNPDMQLCLGSSGLPAWCTSIPQAGLSRNPDDIKKSISALQQYFSGAGTQAAGGIPSPDSLGRNSDTLSCPEGSNDLGAVTTKYTGTLKKESGPLKIKLCELKDIPGEGNNASGATTNGGAVVDARVAGAWVALARAAKADGVNLRSSSSFRLADSCGGTGDGSNCARPGQSLHQTGLAIDFADMGGFTPTGSSTSCSGRMTNSGAAWKWMRDNASKYGVKQYSRESWHWDFLGGTNRC